MDNISVFDRSAALPGAGAIDQSDGTAWMAMFSLNLMRIALELAVADPVYEAMALKFFEHFLLIAEAMTTTGGVGLWNEEDGFFYDVLRMSDNDNGGDDGDYELLSLGRAIRAALDDGIDPYAVAGVLVEGAAHAISRVPPDEQEKAATVLMALLRDRLKTRGL